MHLLTWMGLDCADIQRLRHDIRHVLNDRLRRGQRVCGRLDTAGRVHVQRWLCIYIDDDDRMRGQQWHVRCV